MKGVFFQTYGCQMNQLDTVLRLGALASEGYEPVDSAGEADLVLLNTCSVREHAEDKVMSALGALKKHKRGRPDMVIGVVGCMAQKEADRILASVGHVDLVLGPSQIDHLPSFVRQVEAGRERLRAIEHRPVRFERNVASRPQPFQAYVEVIRGCDVRCTFCVVPSTRGPEVSRPPADVLAEVRALAADGVREVTLLGQTVDHYGSRSADGYGLGELLRDVAAIDGLERVRFITSHPRYFDDRIIAAMADLDKVCPYIHMPLQSGSDSVLARMKRKYDLARYRDRIDAIRAAVPDASIASDFIVGFPGETEADFEASCASIEEFGFSNSFIFKYSPRAGTSAFDLVDDVPLAEKKRRNQVLLEIQNRIREAGLGSMIGRTVEILVEGPSKRDETKSTGRTPGGHIVCFDRRDDLIGRLVDVLLDDHTALTLFGRIVEPEGLAAGS